MKLSDRTAAFWKLGDEIHRLKLTDRKALAEKARNENPWFTEENVLLSLEGIQVLLEKEKLNAWAHRYPSEPTIVKTIGVTMAGNIPLVGFHDLLCVLIAGHKIKAKLSSQDSVLIKFLSQKLLKIENRFSERVSLDDSMKGVDALIATGSDNTARYFEYYFRDIPHIIRKNRASVAVVLGEEPPEQLTLLGKDVFSYFGLGCRNVCKLYVPENYDLRQLIESWEGYQSILQHHKYTNNYEYQKTISLMNRESFLDNGFILLKENTNLVSPTAVVFYEKYKSQQDVMEKIDHHREKLQVIVSAKGWFKGSVSFGKAQLPEVTDYADNIDTMKFLLGLK